MTSTTTTPHSPPNPTQNSTNLPGLHRHITGHDPTSGKAIVESTSANSWTSMIGGAADFSVIYTTSQFPVDLTNDADLKSHEAAVADPHKPVGLVRPGGTVCRIVDFAPGVEPFMHRTQSLDFGCVLEGEIEMELDDGVRRVMRRGDVAVQRATNHGWRNESKTEWARMLFVLQHTDKLVVAGKEMGEELSAAKGDTKGLAMDH